MTDSIHVQDELFPQPDAGIGSAITPGLALRDDAVHLMPLEKAAKSIFVKANGLNAYRMATRYVRYAD